MTFNLETEVIEYGARVRLVRVDSYGFNGRDLHPTKNDIGFEGVVVSNDTESAHHVLPGKELDSGDFVCYTVMNEHGRRLELMNFELERVPLPDSLYGHLERCKHCGVYEGGPHVARMHPEALACVGEAELVTKDAYPAGAIVCAEPEVDDNDYAGGD